MNENLKKPVHVVSPSGKTRTFQVLPGDDGLAWDIGKDGVLSVNGVRKVEGETNLRTGTPVAAFREWAGVYRADGES